MSAGVDTRSQDTGPAPWQELSRSNRLQTMQQDIAELTATSNGVFRGDHDGDF